MKEQFIKLRRRVPLGSRALVTAGATALVGVVVLAAALASGSIISVETESGTWSNGASVVSDSSASGGKALQFATPAATPTPTSTPVAGGHTCASPTHILPTNSSDAQDGITLSGYYVDTDTWNFDGYPGSQQTMYVCDYNNWYAMVNVNNNSGDGAVKTYPNVHKDFNSPKISTFSSVTSSYAHTAPGSGDWDYAYDIWINGVASSGSTELMIWTQSAGRQAHVPGIPVVETVTLSGITYDVHRSGGYVAFDMKNASSSGSLNLLEIFNHMIAKGWIPSSSTLGAVDYGVEVCNTGSVNTKFEVNNFAVATQ